MNNLKKWVSGVLCVAASAGVLMVSAPPDVDRAAASGSQAGAAPPAEVLVRSDADMLAQATASGLWMDLNSPAVAPAMASPLSTMSLPQFAADRQGKLVLNSDTHANVEKLLLEQDPQAMRAMLEKVSKALPPQAAAELKVLVGQFQQYSKALAHTISPDNAPENEQEGLKLLDHLHTLRVSYLGAEATQAMFGEEEATTRQLIALMAAENDPGLTQQQKAERAQEILSKRRPAS